MPRISEKHNINLHNASVSSGNIIAMPTFVDDGGGLFTVGDCQVLLYDNDSQTRELKQYTITGGQLSMADTPNEVRYLVVNYNLGNPQYEVWLYSQLSDWDSSSVTPIFTCYNDNNETIHKFPWTGLGEGLPDKNHRRILKTERFARESGFALSVTDPANTVQVGGGIMWAGSIEHSLDAFDSSVVDDKWYFWHHTGTGLTVTISDTASDGILVDPVVIITPGTGYTVGDEISVLAGDGNAIISIDSITPATGAVLTASVVNGGTGYTNGVLNEATYEGWTRQVTTDGTGVYNNTQYDALDGSGVFPVASQDYVVNWIYRDMDTEGHAGYVLGDQTYNTLGEAQASQPRGDLPPAFGVIAFLVGRIITQDGNGTADIVESSFGFEYSGTPVTNHNSLSGLQGGAGGEYFHLSTEGSTIVSGSAGAWNGTIIQQFVASVDGDIGGVNPPFLTLEKFGANEDLVAQFSDGLVTLDTFPTPLSIDLNEGTATVPKSNYVYIPVSTKVLTVSETSWPAEEHIKIAYVFVKDSATTYDDIGAVINQNWNEERISAQGQGHMTDIGAWIRSQGATWFSGVDGGAAGGLYMEPDGTFVTTEGIISQMHRHVYQAQDTADVGTYINVINDPTTPYNRVSNANEMLEDALGGSLTDRYYNIVLAGCANEGGNFSPLLALLPDGSYDNEADALADVDGLTNYELPREFTKESSNGFLIARLTLRNQTDLTFTTSGEQDLRVGGVGFGGGGGSGAGITIVDDTTTNATFYPALADATSGELTEHQVSSTKLYFNPSTGTLNATVFNTLSDAMFKEDIHVINNATDTVKLLEGVGFNWKDNGNKSYGVIAQELEKIIPELVSGDETKSVNYDGLIAFLINAIKEMDERINELENK